MKRSLFTPLWLVATLLALLGIMVALGRYEPELGAGVSNPKNIAAAGFIVLAAFSMGEFFRILGVPALLGYLIAGILFGPHLAPMLPGSPEALFGRSVIEDLALINVLTVGVIGTMGGGELKIAELKDNFKTIAAIVGLNIAVVVPLTALLVFALGEYVPALMPFMAGLDRSHLVAAALMFGVFGAATSPTVTLAVLQDVRAKGRMTSLVLGVVVFADLLLVAMFLLCLTLSKLIVSPEGFSSSVLLAALPGIAAEFGFALIIGIAAGGLVILYLRFIARETLLFTVALIFLASYVCSLVHAETLLAFLTAGFVVQNFSRLGHEMIHSLERISFPVFVIYFMTQAANLDLSAVFGYLPLALMVSAVRVGSLTVASRVGTRVTGAPEAARRHLWLSFFSLGSVDLVLAALVAAAIPAWGVGFQMVIMAIVVMHILGGPPLLKLALDRAGETEGSRRETRQEAAEVDRALEHRDLSVTAEIRLPLPRVRDARLAARLELLRSRALEHHQSVFVAPIEERTKKMEAALSELRSASQRSAERLAQLLEDDELDPERVRADLDRLELEYHRSLESAFRRLEELPRASLGIDAIERFFAELRGLEPFGSTYRVEVEPERFDFEAGDGALIRVLKTSRRLRRALLGSWTRSVPLGRLFKYYVELTVPIYLARATERSAALAEAWWMELGRHFRHSRQVFARLEACLPARPEERVSAAPPSEGPPRTSLTSPPPVSSSSRPAEEAAAPADPEDWPATARGLLSAHLSDARDQLQALESGLARWHSTSLERYTLAVSEPFTQLLDSAERAGTLELPTFRYAPSARFDRSRAAQAQLRERLQREDSLVAGHWGWMYLEQELFLFGRWFRDYQRSIAEAISSRLCSPCERELELFRREFTPSEVGHSVGWRRRLEEEIRPSWRRTERTFHRVLTSFGQGNVGRQLLGLLEGRVSELPSETTVLSVDPETATPDQATVFVARIREWLFSSLVREIALRFVDLHERAQKVLSEGLEALEDVEQIVEFSLLSAGRQPEPSEADETSPSELAEGGLRRAARLLEELSVRQSGQLAQLERWVLRETDAVLSRAMEPIHRRRAEDLRRAISRREQASLVRRGGSWLTQRQRQLASFFDRVWREYVPTLAELAAELRRRLADPPTVLGPDELRRRLGASGAGAARVPASYRRLFAPLPLEIPEFYVPRPETERQLRDAILDWVRGRPMSVLVSGDRGVGKRSLVQHVFADAQRSGADLRGLELRSVILEPESVNEAEIVARLSMALTGETCRGFDELLRQVRRSELRSAVIIENGEKLFARTEEGLRTFRAVMRLIEASRERLLWVVLMRESAVRWLQSAMGVRELYTEVVDVPAFDTGMLARMIQQRHRVSGYSVIFERPTDAWNTLVGRLFPSGPVLREPMGEFFERLLEQSGGNPLLALELWIDTLEVDEHDDQVLRVRPLEAQSTSLVEGLYEPQPLILSLLAQHGALSLAELHQVFSGLGVNDVSGHLSHLARVGFVEMASGQGVFRLRPVAEAFSVRELRERGWL